MDIASNGENKENGAVRRTADIQVADEFTFSKFLLSDKLLKSLNRLNYQRPSPIQLKVLPLAKCGLDMIIQAKSGTGKTLAFAICILESYDEEIKFPQSLVVVPTREIAVQIVSVLNELGRNVKQFRACEFIGGTELTNDRKKIQSAKVVVGTPGRILHLINNEVFNINGLKSIVLDEADKLLQNGQMAKDVTKILNLMHKNIQMIATTATVTDKLEKIMKRMMKNPIGITPKQEVPVLLGIKQFVKILPRENDNILLTNAKIDELHKIFTRIAFKQCLLFTCSQSKTESYGNYLHKRGWKNEVINGAQDQSQRLKVLDNLVNFKCRILITTDLMARGIDLENVNLIINLDLPQDCFTYLHRIGRAGRFGTHGIAITFVNGEEGLEKFQKLLGDINGEALKALKYPDDSVPYDFWNFDDGNVLDTICGLSKNSKNNQFASSASSTKDDEVVLNNLALLEITRMLVDEKSNEDQRAFDLNSIIEDYEKNRSEDIDQEHVENEEASIECEDLFLKTIRELELYDDENGGELPKKSKIEAQATAVIDDHRTDKSLIESANVPPKADVEKPQKFVIFKRPTIVDDDEEEMSVESSDVHETTDEEEEFLEQNTAEDEQGESEEQEFYHHQTSGHSTARDGYASYHNYVAGNYAQWRNIFHFQLANIQNYIANNRNQM